MSSTEVLLLCCTIIESPIVVLDTNSDTIILHDLFIPDPVPNMTHLHQVHPTHSCSLHIPNTRTGHWLISDSYYHPHSYLCRLQCHHLPGLVVWSHYSCTTHASLGIPRLFWLVFSGWRSSTLLVTIPSTLRRHCTYSVADCYLTFNLRWEFLGIRIPAGGVRQ